MALCPCTSGKEYDVCCRPYLDGAASAPTAEALMRSRYTAYARVKIDYLTRTHHSRTLKNHDPQQAETWARESTWKGLEIVATEAGKESDDEGVVEFIARYEDKDGEEQEHHERSTFGREDGKWRYVDGRVIGPDPIRREVPKVGRNDPCPCGSGKKYKKCCGAA